MADLQDLDTLDETTEQNEARNSRRRFLQIAATSGAAAALAFAGCDTTGVKPPGGRPDPNPGPGPDQDPETITFDFSSDVGVLNFAYALEQLEATFYVMACNNFYGGSEIEANYQAALRSPGAALQSQQEIEEYYIAALRSRENAHAVFFREVIPPGPRIPNLEFDFSSIDFSSRTEVLSTAMTFENTGTSGYNGAANFLSGPNAGLYLALAGKIVSVEARHAAVLRQILFGDPKAFADLDDPFLLSLGAEPENGLDVAQPPEQVIEAVQPFVVQTLVVTGT